MCDRAEEIRGAGAELVVIGNGSPRHAAWFAEEQSVPITVLTDPTLAAYRVIEARRSPLSSLGAGAVRSSWRAFRSGFRSGRILGDPWQQGAVWVVLASGEVAYRYTSVHAGDHPDPTDILAALRKASSAAGT